MKVGAEPLRILVADPLDLVAEGLRAKLHGTDLLAAVTHADTGTRVLELLTAAPFDLLLLEVSLPVMDGIDTMRAVHRHHPTLPVLAHSTLTEIEYVNSMLIEGAVGYLVKGGDTAELVHAIRAVLSGARYVSPAAQASVDAGYAFTEKRMDGDYVGLTAREREIIRLIALERTNGEIAAALFISEDTVKTHRKNLMTKLNVRSVAGLVKYAIDRRWV
ncbi:MAG: response regulator transcription factor [Flavobacteriales bacterium]